MAAILAVILSAILTYARNVFLMQSYKGQW